MLPLRQDLDYKPMLRKKRKFFAAGDRIITKKNRILGTVDYIDKDEQGEFVVVHLDNMPGAYAFEPFDIEKI